MFRVVSGALKSDSTVSNKSKEGVERLGSLMLLQGKTPTTVPEIKAGDLGAVAKLKDTLTSDTLGDKADPVTFPAMTFPEPVLSYAIEPKSRGDEDKISIDAPARGRGSAISTAAIPRRWSCCCRGRASSHIEVTVAKLKRRFGVTMNLKPPRIPYRNDQGIHRGAWPPQKQTGGHGQFGDCKIRVEPLPRGTDFEFVDDIFGGSIPRQFVPAVREGHSGCADERLSGRLSDGRFPRHRVRRLVTTTWTRTSSHSSWPGRWPSRTPDAGPPDASRARHACRGLRTLRLRRRLDGRLERPPGPNRRDGHARCDHRHQGPSTDVGNAHLRATPDVGDRRARLVSHGIFALRGGAVASAGEDHRGGKGRTHRGRGGEV